MTSHAYWEWEGIEREEWEYEMDKWMRFWTFDFVSNQNKFVYNVQLEHTHFGQATYFI